jgi:DNA mismatch repair protein MutS
VEARLREVLPDELTPKEALALIYALKGMVG